MSDDDSFVVLGSSPGTSLNINNDENLIKSNGDWEQPKLTNGVLENSVKTITNGMSISSKTVSDGMAASFILGDIQPEVMKESVYSQFPSLNDSMRSTEDVMKLQNLITSNVEMKETLRKTNDTMSEWMAKTKKIMDDYKNQIRKCQEETGKLRNENEMLQKQLNEKVKHIEMMEQIRTQENDQLRMGISEKSSQILNMQQKIIHLEEQQLHSFDLLRETKPLDLENEYVPMEEHKRIVKDLERKMSEILAENLEIKNMQSVYLDEINCLKVNLTSLEELYNKAKSDIKIIQSDELTKSQAFTDYEKKIKHINEEMAILKIQVETYQKDFESERDSRQNLAGERDNLLVELKKLQVNNQKLIEEAEQNISQTKKKPVAASPRMEKTEKKKVLAAAPKEPQIYERVVYTCPLCACEQKTLGALQNHVQACLDEAN